MLIDTIRPKADAGDAEAIKLVAQIEAFIERMTISRQYCGRSGTGAGPAPPSEEHGHAQANNPEGLLHARPHHPP